MTWGSFLVRDLTSRRGPRGWDRLALRSPDERWSTQQSGNARVSWAMAEEGVKTYRVGPETARIPPTGGPGTACHCGRVVGNVGEGTNSRRRGKGRVSPAGGGKGEDGQNSFVGSVQGVLRAPHGHHTHPSVFGPRRAEQHPASSLDRFFHFIHTRPGHPCVPPAATQARKRGPGSRLVAAGAGFHLVTLVPRCPMTSALAVCGITSDVAVGRQLAAGSADPWAKSAALFCWPWGGPRSLPQPAAGLPSEDAAAGAGPSPPDILAQTWNSAVIKLLLFWHADLFWLESSGCGRRTCRWPSLRFSGFL